MQLLQRNKHMTLLLTASCLSGEENTGGRNLHSPGSSPLVGGVYAHLWSPKRGREGACLSAARVVLRTACQADPIHAMLLLQATMF